MSVTIKAVSENHDGLKILFDIPVCSSHLRADQQQHAPQSHMLPAMWPTAMWETASLAINDVLLQQSSGMPEYRIMNSKRGILQGERDIPQLVSDRDRDVSNSWPFLTSPGLWL